MAFITYHFKRISPEPRQRVIYIPGYVNPVTKFLAVEPLEILQYGTCDKSAGTRAGLEANLYDESAAADLDALNLGSYPHMYKVRLEFDGEMSAIISPEATGGFISYRLTWRQVCVASP